MHRADSLLTALHTALLGVAAGVLIAVGAAAAVAFATSADLDITVVEYEAVDEPHNRLLPGLIMNTIFRVADAVVAGCILLGSAALVIAFARRGKAFLTPVGVLRLAAGTILLAITLFQTLLFRPALNDDLDAYHEAARAGDMATAEPRKAEFDQAHPKATLLLMAQLGLVGVALTLNVAQAVVAGGDESSGGDGDNEKKEGGA